MQTGGPAPNFGLMEQFHGTTIVSVRRQDADGRWQVAIGGDGQVTLGNVVVKGSARKVRKLYHDKVVAGFAGATADAFTLFERFEAKLEKHQGHLVRSAIEFGDDLLGGHGGHGGAFGKEYGHPYAEDAKGTQRTRKNSRKQVGTAVTACE